jgi:hypothetical protein
MNRAPFNRDRGALRLPDQELLNVPRLRRFDLSPGRIKLLVEISLPVEQGDAHHRESDISGRSERVAGKDTEAACVGGHLGDHANFHREVSA